MLPFVCGGLGGMTADLAATPFDVVRIRLQNQTQHFNLGLVGQKYSGMRRGLATIATDEGIPALYKGLSAALLRQSVYCTLRIGLYDAVKGNMVQARGYTSANDLRLMERVACGLTAGALASGVANPTDLARVRLQNQAETGQSRKYRGLLHFFRKAIREEGFRGLYTGARQTVQRAALVTATEQVAYDVFKNQILLDKFNLPDNSATHFLGALGSSLVNALVTTPFDLAKTRVMSDLKSPGARRVGTLEVMQRIAHKEGALSLYKGFVPYLTRCTPWGVVYFLSYEQFKQAYLAQLM